jgi:hypothetical protein
MLAAPIDVRDKARATGVVVEVRVVETYGRARAQGEATRLFVTIAVLGHGGNPNRER